MHAEDPRDRDIRLRQQLLIDEERKLAATTAKDYKEKFASDYPKAIAIIYSLVSEMKKYWQIGTTLKCQRKKKGNDLPD